MAKTEAKIEKIIQPTKGGLAYVALLKTADRFKCRMEKILAPFDITAQQYNVLRILRGAEPKGLPTLTIAERMIEQTPGITRMIDRLEAKELVKRKFCSQDRRRVFCRISEKGLTLLDQLHAPVDVKNDFLNKLDDKEIEQLTVLLNKILDGLE